MGKRKANEVTTPTESFDTDDPNILLDRAKDLRPEDVRPLDTRVQTAPAGGIVADTGGPTDDPNALFDKAFGNPPSGNPASGNSTMADKSGPRAVASASSPVASDILAPTNPSISQRIARTIEGWLAGVPEQRRKRLVRENEEGKPFERKTVYYRTPAQFAEDQHGRRREIVPAMDGVWTNYDYDTGDPLPDSLIEKIPDGAKVLREEGFTEETMSPYYHAAKEARSFNANVARYNEQLKRSKEQLAAETDGPEDLAKAVFYAPLQRYLNMQKGTGIRRDVPSLPEQGWWKPLPGIDQSKSVLEETTDSVKKIAVNALKLAASTSIDGGSSAATLLGAAEAAAELADTYYNPTNPIEYWLGNAAKLAMTVGKYATGTALAATGGAQAIGRVTGGILNPGSIIAGGAVLDGAELVSRMVITPARGLVPMDTDDAKVWLRENFPKAYLGDMSDEDVRNLANGMKRIVTMISEREAIADGKWAGLGLVPFDEIKGLMRTRSGKMMTKGLLDWMHTGTFGESQLERDIDMIGQRLGDVFTYDGGDADFTHMLKDLEKAERRLEPQGLGDIIWQGVGAAAPMMPFFAASISKAGGKAFPMLETMKKVGHDLQGVIRQVPGAARSLARDLGLAGIDTGLFAMRAGALGIAQWSDTNMKDAHYAYRTLIDRGATPVQAFLNSYGLRAAGNAIENFTEAGHLELFRATRGLMDGALKKTGKAMLAQLNEGLEERGAEWAGFAIERASGLPADLRQFAKDPAELNIAKWVAGLDELQMDQLNKAIGDYAISGILGIGFGAFRAGISSAGAPINTSRRLFRAVHNALADPRRQAEKYAEAYSFDINPATGEKESPETVAQKVDALEKIIRLNSFAMGDYRMQTVAKSIATSVHSIDVDALARAEGVEDKTQKWFLTKDELRTMFANRGKPTRRPAGEPADEAAGKPIGETPMDSPPTETPPAEAPPMATPPKATSPVTDMPTEEPQPASEETNAPTPENEDPLVRILDEEGMPDAPPPAGPEDEGWQYQLGDPVADTRLTDDRLADDPDFAEDIENELRSIYPDVSVGTITGESQSGRRVLGRANTQAMQVLFDPEFARRDTLPHEYLHTYVDLFERSPAVQDGIRRYGSKEAFVERAGEYYIGRKDDGFIRRSLKDFLGFLQGLFGRKDSAFEVARRFERGTDAFSFASRAKAAKLETAKLETSEVARPPLTRRHEMTTRRESFNMGLREGHMTVVPGYRVQMEDMPERAFYLAHPVVEGTRSDKWVLADVETGKALTPHMKTRAAAIEAFSDMMESQPDLLQRIEDESAYAAEKEARRATPVASPNATLSAGQLATTEETGQARPYKTRQLSVRPLAGMAEKATNMQANLERVLGGEVSLTDGEVRQLLAMRDGNGKPPVEEMMEIIDRRTESDYDAGRLRAWLIANHKRLDMPIISVSIPQYGSPDVQPSDPVLIDVAPPGTAQRNGEGGIEQTYRNPPNIAELADIGAFLRAYELVPNDRIASPIGLLNAVRVGGKTWPLGELAERKPEIYSRMEATLAAHGMYMIGSGGKNDVFMTINLNRQAPLSQKTARALLTGMDKTEEYWRRKVGQNTWNESEAAAEFRARRQRMPVSETGQIDTTAMTPHDRMFAVYAAFNEYLQDDEWGGTGNKLVKYYKELTAADRPTITTNAAAWLDDLRLRIDDRIASQRGSERRLMRQVRDGLRVLAPGESESAALLDGQDYDVLAGGIAVHRTTGDVAIVTAFVDHDHYDGRTPHGDGGNAASPLTSMFLSFFEGGDARAKLLKPRILRPGSDASLLVKSMLDVMDGQMLDAAHAVGVGLLVFDSTLKLGRTTLQPFDAKTGERLPLPKYAKFESLALSGGKTSGIPLKLVSPEKVTLVNDPEGSDRDDTALGTQGMMAVPIDPLHWPHLADEYEAMRDFFEGHSERTVRMLRRFHDDAQLRGALYRRLAKGMDDPAAAPFVAMIEEAGRDNGVLYYTPHLQAAMKDAAHAALMSPVTSNAQSGSSRVIGQSLKLTPDFGAATGTNMLAVLRANGGDVSALRKYFDVENVIGRGEVMAHITPEQKRMINEETAKLIAERDKLRRELITLAPADHKAIAQANARLDDIVRRIEDREQINFALAEAFLRGSGYRKVGEYYCKGTGHLRPIVDGAVPIVVDEGTARRMGWEAGKRVLVTAIPADAPHSTKACVIAGLSDGVGHRISWSAAHTIQLGKDHDGDALYVRGASDGYWQRRADRLEREMNEKYVYRGKDAPEAMKDAMTEYRAYADTGWMEMPAEQFDAIWKLYADPKVQDYADSLYRRMKIDGAFSEEAVDLLQSVFGNRERGTIPTPLDSKGRRWLVANYVGATAGIIGKVANVRRKISYIVQAYPELIDMARVGNTGLTNLEMVDLVNTILVNHAVDAPAQEHLFGYNYDSEEHLDWAIGLLIADDNGQQRARDAVREFDEFLMAQRGRFADGNSIPTHLQYEMLSAASRMDNPSLAAAMARPFRRPVPFSMSAGFFTQVLAPQIARHMAAETFGPGTELFTPEMIGAKGATRPLTASEQDTIFGLMKQAWTDGLEVEDMQTREVLRGPVRILTHMTAAMALSRQPIPTKPRPTWNPVTRRMEDPAPEELARYGRDIKYLRDTFNRFAAYKQAYFDSPLADMAPMMLSQVQAMSGSLVQPRAYLQTGLEGASGFQFSIDRHTGLNVSADGQAFVPVTPRFIAGLFTADPGPKVVAARTQLFSVMQQAAEKAADVRHEPLHLVSPADAVRHMGDMIEDYVSLDPGPLAARHRRLTDALMIALVQERFATLQPFAGTGQVELFVAESMRHPLARSSYDVVEGLRARPQDLSSLAKAGNLADASFGTFAEAAELNLLGFRFMSGSLRSLWLSGLARTKAGDVWYKSHGDEFAAPQPQVSRVETTSDAAQIDAEELEMEAAAAERQAQDLIGKLKDNERILAEGPEKLAADVATMRGTLARILDRLEATSLDIDRQLKRSIRIAAQGLNAFGAASGILAGSLLALNTLLRKTVQLMRRLADAVRPFMVSGVISRHSPVRTFAMTDRFGPQLQRALFTYGKRRVRIFGNSIQELISFTREGMTGWFDRQRTLSQFDLVLAAMRAMGYEVSTAHRMFTDTVRGFVNSTWADVARIARPQDREAFFRDWQRTVIEEMHLGELFAMRLIHDGRKWMWLVGKDKTFEYGEFDPERLDFNSRAGSFVTEAAVRRFGSKAAALASLRLVMRLRRLVAENSSNVLHNQVHMAGTLAAAATDPDTRARYEQLADSYRQILKRIQAGRPYFPLAYNNMATAVEQGQTRNQIEMLAATASAEYFENNPEALTADDAEAVREEVQLRSLLEVIRQSGLGGIGIARSVMARPAAARLEAAKQQLTTLFENTHQRVGGGHLAFGMDANMLHRAVNYKAILKAEAMATGLAHDPRMYVAYDIAETLDAMMNNHLTGLLGSYFTILRHEHVAPHAALFADGVEEMDRRMAEVFHMNIYTQIVPWDRVLRGDDLNMTVREPEEVLFGDDPSGQTPDTVWHERTVNVRVHKVLAGVHGNNVYLVGLSSPHGPVYWLVDPHTDRITVADETGKAIVRSDARLRLSKDTGLVAFHTRVRDYVPWKERRMRRKASRDIALANDDAFLKRMRGLERKRRHAWKVLNNLGGLFKLGFNLPSVANNNKYYLYSAWWHTGRVIPHGKGSMADLQNMIGNADTPESRRIGEMLARALDALPNMYDWRFYVQVASIGAEVDDAVMARSFLQLMSDHREAMEMAEAEARSRGLEGQRGAALIAQRVADAVERKYGRNIAAYFSEAARGRTGALVTAYGYRMFQIAEEFNRNWSTITTLMQTRRVFDQFFDPLDEGGSGKLVQLPPAVQATLLRQWVLYARQQDENINYDYSRIMRPRWLRSPMMEFMGKFAVFSNAAWSQRLQNIGEARKLYAMGRSADMLFVDEEGRLGRNRAWWKSRMHTKTYISAADVPPEEWAQFVRDVYGYASEEGIDDACRRIAEKLEKEGITIEAARFNPVARAIRFGAVQTLQGTLRLLLWDYVMLTVEPMLDFAGALLDMFGMFGPPDDEEEIIRALQAIYPEGHPFWDNEANLDMLYENPLYKQYREKKFESILQRIAMSSPVGGLVISQLTKWLGAYVFGPLAGVDYRPTPGESMQAVFKMASTKTFADYLATAIEIRDGEKEAGDMIVEVMSPLFPEGFAYWQRKMQSESESVIKASYPLARTSDAGAGIEKTSRVDPVEKQAKANIQRLRNEARREGVIPGLGEIMLTKGDVWRLMPRRDRQLLDRVYLKFERARLGSPKAYEDILSDPVKYPYEAYLAWLEMMKRRGIPATMDPAWVRAYISKVWPDKAVPSVEYENMYE